MRRLPRTAAANTVKATITSGSLSLGSDRCPVTGTAGSDYVGVPLAPMLVSSFNSGCRLATVGFEFDGEASLHFPLVCEVLLGGGFRNVMGTVVPASHQRF